jgi:caffeoylshikimate esterase
LKGRAWFGRRKREAFAMAPVVKLAGVDKELKKILEANMDQVPARRRAREAFKDIQLQIDHILFKVFSFL